MRKIYYSTMIALFLMLLVACGSEGTTTSKENNKSRETETVAKEVSVNTFMASMNTYLEKQNALMLKQAEGDISTEAEDLIRHAKEVVSSKEFKEWQQESQKIDNLKMKESKNSEAINTFLKAFKEYNHIQAEYFIELSEAVDTDSYNAVNERLEAKLVEAQNKFEAAFNDIEMR